MSSSELIVDLAERSYPIFIGRDLSDKLKQSVADLAQQNRKAAVLVDNNLLMKHQEQIDDIFGSLPLIHLPGGEGTKCFSCMEEICSFLAQDRIDRTGVLYVIGGGVIGDLGGFSAASYLRGIDFYQVPTTLLSMVDSSVGGKTGINIKEGKNLVGAFWQPQAVFADMAYLDTLPAREFAAGMGEIIKYGMLYDIDLLEKLEAIDSLDSRSSELPDIVHRCCEIKAEIVKADERETEGSGGRALLNLGHTFCHAIEAVAGYGSYLHGEAVAIGLVLATRLSEELGAIDSQTERIVKLVEKYQLPSRLREALALDKLLDAMMRDKKVKHGKLRFVSMEEMGKAITVNDVDMELVSKLWLEVGAVES